MHAARGRRLRSFEKKKKPQKTRTDKDEQPKLETKTRSRGEVTSGGQLAPRAPRQSPHSILKETSCQTKQEGRNPRRWTGHDQKLGLGRREAGQPRGQGAVHQCPCPMGPLGAYLASGPTRFGTSQMGLIGRAGRLALTLGGQITAANCPELQPGQRSLRG